MMPALLAMTATTTFIIGPPRCGTTLLKDLLAAHPELTVHGEDFHPFHHDLTRFRDRTDARDHFRLTAAEATVELAREYGARIDRARQESGCEHFVLKISTLSIQVDYVLALFPEARFIQLVRDGRDAACSMEDLRIALGRHKDEPRTLGPAPDPLGLWCAEHFAPGHLRAAASWSYHAVHSWLDLRWAGAGRFRRFRYEDLLADPRRVVDAAQRFIGVDPADQIEPLLDAVTDTPGPANGLGFSTSQTAGARRVGRYLDDMSAATRTVIAPLLELPMVLFGYQPDPWPEVEPFFAACGELGIDAELWRDRVKREVAFFEQHNIAFSPERLGRDWDVRDCDAIDAIPLLVDGATVGSERTLLDGGVTNTISWIRKQDRRHTFVDPSGRWPEIAAACDGRQTLAQLRARFELGEEAIAVLGRLAGLGFVGFV